MNASYDTVVGSRRCRNCTFEINPRELALLGPDDNWTLNRYAAWLAGYCTPDCQRSHALAAVNKRSAWWLR